MPGIEKRVARFPQFYTRIGFVHEFRPLAATEMQKLLEQQWTPTGVSLPEGSFTPEVVARLVRVTSGNLRLLTQIERVLSVRRSCLARNRRSRSRQPRYRSGLRQCRGYDK